MEFVLPALMALAQAGSMPVPCQLPAGFPVEVEIMQAVSSRGHRGDRFPIRLRAPLTSVSGDTPMDIEGVGEIVHADSARMGGKPGELILAARYLVFDGRQVRLRSMRLGGAGKDHFTASAVATGVAAAAAGPAAVLGLFVRGGQIEIPAGTVASAKLAENYDVCIPAPSN